MIGAARWATAKRHRHGRTTRRRYVLKLCAHHGFGERSIWNLGRILEIHADRVETVVDRIPSVHALY